MAPTDRSLSLKSLPMRDASVSGLLAPDGYPQTPSTPRGITPLISKVTSVLSTTHSDTEFRDALALLDERGIQNDAETRRRVRLDLQKEVIDSNGEVIAEFGRVAEQLRRIKTTIDKLNNGYEDMKSQVIEAHRQTLPALSEASSLLEQKRQVEVKQELLGAFKKHFVMSENEVAALTQTAEPVDDRFFDALSKAKKISKDCEILLGFEKQTLGLELMEQTSKNINLGFQKLYKWIQREFKTLNLENPQMNSSIRRALRVLAERPSLFQNCLDFFSEARERILSDSFYVALTGASPSGTEDPSVKPIDMLAHDPLRYVGDMLAWIHSATVSEREALEVLFVAEGEELAKGFKSGRDAEIWRLIAEDDEAEADFNALKALNDLVDRDVSGAARVLRQRMEQVIQANEDTIPAYKLANLINFYRITFQKMLGPNSNLVELIGGLETEALRQFRALVRDHIATLQGEFQHAPLDLGPPAFLQDSLKQLKAISKTYDSSLSTSEDRESEFENVLSEAFEPFMSGCENMAKNMNAQNGAIFLINCISSAIACLEPFEFTQRRAKRLREKSDDAAKGLITSQYQFLRKGSGLDAIFTELEEDDDKNASLLDEKELAQASQTLDDFLPSALMDAMDNLKHLQDSKLARQITEEAAEQFCNDFEQLEEVITGGGDESVDSEEDEGLRSVFPRTTAEIRLFLGALSWLIMGAMLRNRALAVLQKTYDDSYLSCSTAIYYEGQGNEIEAMRHWRAALDQIYDYNANRAPPAYGPRTDTEKALQEALKQLELQCKERIDLLEALRISRQEETTSPQPPPGKLTKRPSIPEGRGSLGQGTITAMQYSELSRPTLPHRPSQPRRTSSELAIVDGPSTHLDPNMAFLSLSRSASPGGPALPPRPNKTLRTPSPEKHTMRTTLRSGKLGEKSTKPRKPAKPLAEGSSKAATLAWSALGSRERFARGVQSESTPAPASPSSRTSLDQIRRPVPTQWDSHSRRLVVPKDRDLDGEPSGNTRHSDEYCYARPSMLSVTAASSALNSSSYQDLPSSDAYTSRTDRLPNSRSGFASPSPRKVSRQERANDTETGDDSGEASERRSVSNNVPTRSPAARQPGRSLKPSKPHAESRDRSRRRERKVRQVSTSSASDDDTTGTSSRPRRVREKEAPIEAGSQEDDSDASESETLEKSPDDMSEWKTKKKQILKNLPAGVDAAAAKQILNDIVVQGDEVHWSDVAGLEIAKNALRETVVYPFLRPDLFMGLREPARGMLLFGPPGTGKTMLARAVATESKSTFFSISASSLTSKYLGESEKLVRALFGLARTLAPSIIFVDEIDSLLSQRSGSGEHEATMRIKTEFLIQWSDLQRAAAGREATEKDKERGDANRVLVLAATNLPWAIDEAARRRFVRRQYIPLPEPTTRETQLRTLLGQQKHDLSNDDILKLVELTDGFSGSDITALAKDAAMGPLRSLGEALLHMTMDEIRPIQLSDFEASLTTIRPSVSKAGLKEYEDWATEFGERGG
ncbi:hypothetical protein ACKAV7_002671 [Fusarium commune]